MKFKLGLLASFVWSSLFILALAVQAEISLEPGNPAPTFFLYDRHGKEHFLSDYAGTPRRMLGNQAKRFPVIINFFGVNCKPCEEEIPYLAKLAATYQDDGLKVLLVSKDSRSQLESYVEKRNLQLTILVDEFEQVNRKYLVSGIPVLYLIGPDGKILLRRFGFDHRDNKELEVALRRLFKKTEPKSPVAPKIKATPKPQKK